MPLKLDGDGWWRTLSGGVARCVLAATFAYAAWPKLLDPQGFAAAIRNYHLLPELAVRVGSVGLPVLEACVAAALLWPRLARGACLIAFGLLLTFAGAMTQALVRGINLDCGCFGQGAEVGVDAWSVTRNLGLCGLALWGLWTTRVPQPKAAGTLTP